MDDLTRAVAVLLDLASLGVRMVADGDRLKLSPRSIVSPEMLERIKACKFELLAIVRGDSEILDEIRLRAIWHGALADLEADETFPRDALEALRRAKAKWSDSDGTKSAEKKGDQSGAASSSIRCPRCGTTGHKDVAIHGGQSVRRDCSRCGRFLEFPVWYGRRKESPETPTGAVAQ